MPVTRAFFRLSSAPFLRSFRSLRAQLIFWNVLAVALLLGGLGIVCRIVTFSFMMQSVEQELERSTGMFQRHKPARFHPFGHDRPPPPGQENHPPPPRPIDANNPFPARLFYAVGKAEMPGDNAPALDAAALTRALHGETVRATIMVDGEPVRVFSAPGLDRQNRPGAVQAGYPLKEVYRAIAGIDTALLILIPVGLLGAWWLGVALTNRVLKPVQRMTQAAGRMGAVDFSQRLPVSGSDEFSELAETFNGLLGRVDSAFQEQKRLLQLQRRFTADASHELKTPLTIIKGSASLALGRASTDERSCHTFQEIDAAANTMSQLVQDLLLLARSDEGQLGHDRTELLVREILERAKGQAAEKEGAPILLTIEPEELSVTGNEAELTRLFRNLLDNAACYTPPKGQITVTARSLKGNVVVTVKDTGIGMAPEHLPHLGERFYRADASRTRPTGGTGLGLSICRGIVEAHGGTLAFESAPGAGTTVTVTLPGQSDLNAGKQALRAK